MISTHKELADKVEKLEEKFGRHDKDIRAIIDLIRRLHSEPEKQKMPIGFHAENERNERDSPQKGHVPNLL